MLLKNKQDFIDCTTSAVLFDLDGVLVDSYQYWFKLFNQTLWHFGHPRINRAVFKKHWGQSTGDDVRIFMPERTLEEVKEYFTRNLTKYMKHMKANPRAARVLRGLKQKGFLLGCVTNSHRQITVLELRATKLKKFFDAIVTADDVKKPKPAPDMLIWACRELGVPVKRAVFVGDTRTDLAAGKKAGCKVIGYRIKSRVLINDLEELLQNSPPIPLLQRGKRDCVR
ncbi:MAG TPA: HAD family hydrolase [bacterium]